MGSYIFKLYLLLLFVSAELFATSIIVDSHINKLSLLEHSEVVFNNNSLELQELLNQNLFKPYNKSHFNSGISNSVWIKFNLKNSSNYTIKKVLFFSSPLLESIKLYKGLDTQPILRGLSFKQLQHFTLPYYYDIVLAPKSRKEYYIKVETYYTPLSFALYLEDKKLFLKDDRYKQFANILLIGMLIALMLYALVLAFYSKDRSYFYYSLYLFFIIYQQFTYVGLTQIYLSFDFIVLDMQLAIVKISTLMLTSALFAMSFLKTEDIPWLHRLYRWFLLLITLEMFIFSMPKFYNIQVIILTGAVFIVFNIIGGIIAYKEGHKEARLFIVGFGTVFISYSLMIIDGLGVASVIHHFPNLLMWCSVIEALVLSLAFTDRYKLLQNAKEKTDRELLENLKNREKIIKDEVKKKTLLLNQAVKAKELLLKELHHRIKNNLQIILSMIRLQRDKINDKYVVDKFIRLENRINAIAKTYNLLLLDNNLEAIDMQEYINALLLDLVESMCGSDCNVEVKTDISAELPLRESIYVGIIINELVTNAYKYAFDGRRGEIFISLKQKNNEFILIVRDNGNGFIYNKDSKSLGLKLIHSLVIQQLKGEIEMISKNLTQYTIRFSL